jgi:hypothetical protein
MIARRRNPSTTPLPSPLAYSPASSGPRWRCASVMRLTAARRSLSIAPIAPAIPHIACSSALDRANGPCPPSARKLALFARLTAEAAYISSRSQGRRKVARCARLARSGHGWKKSPGSPVRYGAVTRWHRFRGAVSGRGKKMLHGMRLARAVAVKELTRVGYALRRPPRPKPQRKACATRCTSFLKVRRSSVSGKLHESGKARRVERE